MNVHLTHIWTEQSQHRHFRCSRCELFWYARKTRRTARSSLGRKLVISRFLAFGPLRIASPRCVRLCDLDSLGATIMNRRFLPSQVVKRLDMMLTLGITYTNFVADERAKMLFYTFVAGGMSPLLQELSSP